MIPVPLIAYLDETGDHSLNPIDLDFPVFGTVLFICEFEEYIEQVVPDYFRFKFDYFGHEGVILHSRDIRRAQGEFGFLTDPAKRPRFYKRINAMMSGHDYQLIATFIHKGKHKDKYGSYAVHPYELALEFTLERLIRLLEYRKQKEILIIAEARGTREDDELKLSFLKFLNRGTDYVRSDRFKAINFRLEFIKKERNLIGTQIADLAAYPIARHVLDPGKDNPAYDIVRRKLHGGRLKVFP